MAHLVFLRRVVNRKENLAHPALRLAGVLLEPLQRVVDLVVGNRQPLRRLPLHQLRPEERGRQLIDDGGALDAAHFQELVKLPGPHVVLLFELLDPLLHLLFGDCHVLPLGLLQLQFLVDQRAQHLRNDSLTILRRVRNIRRNQHHPRPRGEIVKRDHIVVDDRRNAGRRRAGLRLPRSGLSGGVRRCRAMPA